MGFRQLVSPLKEVGLQPAFLRSRPPRTMTQDNQDIRNRLIELAEPVCSDAGYELVDLRYVREQSGWVVRAFIDYAGDASETIGFEDCESVSRELSAVFDVEDPVPSIYSLEVSSPGVERPLRTAAHFRRYLGQPVKVMLADGLDGRRNFKGTVESVAGDGSTVAVVVDGQSFSLPLSDLRSAKLVVDYDALLKGNTRSPRGNEQAGA